MEATDQIGAYGPDAWPVNWNGIVLGMLGTLAALLVIGLSGVALEAHQAVGPDRVILDWHKVGWGTVFSASLERFSRSPLAVGSPARSPVSAAPNRACFMEPVRGLRRFPSSPSSREWEPPGCTAAG